METTKLMVMVNILMIMLPGWKIRYYHLERHYLPIYVKTYLMMIVLKLVATIVLMKIQ